MRSRYGHDGSVDYHAESEHEILRRAEEALERQRLAEHANQAASHLSHYAAPIAPSAGGSSNSSAAAITTPKYPHDEIAARLAVVPAPLASSHIPTTPRINSRRL